MSARFTTLGRYPTTRLRRNRGEEWSRRLVAEHKLSVNDLIWPVFVQEGQNTRAPVASMPGVDRLSIDLFAEAAREARDLGIPAIAIFPETDPKAKTPDAREAYNPGNLVCRAITAVKKAVPDIGIVCDVALDPFNSDGHDGIDARRSNPERRDRSRPWSSRPSCRPRPVRHPGTLGHDGRPHRRASGRRSTPKGFQHEQIMSYAAKYASAFYGPVPRRHWQLGRAEGRQEDLPDGLRQLGRGAARGGLRHRRRRRHGDGEAGYALSRHRAPREGGVRRADLRLSRCQWRVRDADGRRRSWLARLLQALLRGGPPAEPLALTRP
jgi:hypothetical protein